MKLSNQIANLSHQLPAAFSIAERVGLHRQRTLRRRRIERAGLFGVGLAIGSGLAVLLAPRSGSETRRLLRARMEDAREYVTSEAAGEPAHRASHAA
jgi:hypothetical protein